MTLIEAHQNGVLVGRCDERCYGAREGECHCICQGRNHGAGLEQALANTRTQSEEWKAAEQRRRGRNRLRFRCPLVDQPNLWEVRNGDKHSNQL